MPSAITTATMLTKRTLSLVLNTIFSLFLLSKEGRDYCRLAPPCCSVGLGLMGYKVWRNFGESPFHELGE
jgi:hypothetical protein